MYLKILRSFFCEHSPLLGLPHPYIIPIFSNNRISCVFFARAFYAYAQAFVEEATYAGLPLRPIFC